MTGSTRKLLALALGLAIAGPAFAQSATAPTQTDPVDRATQPAAPPATPAAQAQRTEEDRRTMPPQDPTWARLDADRDGRISPIESDADSKFGLSFDDMDTDEDGFVSSAEYGAFGKAAAPPTTAQGAAQATAGVQAATQTTGVNTDTFGGLDLDKDGRVSSTEAGKDAGFDAGFAAMDSNGDGFVTDAEHKAHAEAKSKP